jgi:hypothetical protein
LTSLRSAAKSRLSPILLAFRPRVVEADEQVEDGVGILSRLLGAVRR